MGLRGEERLYDAYYFAHSCGRPYRRDAHWLSFFRDIARRITEDLGPATVLDAGCAMGFLVEALRERGIDARGIDVSSFALEAAAPEVRPHCTQACLTTAIESRYDLVVCIEVIEHLSAEDGRRAIANLCRATDDILFSSTPVDFREPTHENVQPPEYWAESFARHGFFRDVEYDAGYVSPWAARFRRLHGSPATIVAAYERRLWALQQENQGRREMAIEQRDSLADRERTIARLEGESAAQRAATDAATADLAALRAAAATAAADLERLRGEAAAATALAAEWRARSEAATHARERIAAVTAETLAAARAEQAHELAGRDARLADLSGRIERAARESAELRRALDAERRAARAHAAHWDRIRQSRGWAALQAVWRLRARLRSALGQRPVEPPLGLAPAAPSDRPAAERAEHSADGLASSVTGGADAPAVAPDTDAMQALVARGRAWSPRSVYTVPAGVRAAMIDERPTLTTPEGGQIAVDGDLLAIWRAAAGRSLEAVLELARHTGRDEGTVRAALACLAEAGCLAREGTEPPSASGAGVRGALVSAIVVAHDGASWLEACLPSLFSQTYAGLEVLVVDNGSSDGTAQWLAREHPRARVIRLARTIPLAAAINRGVAVARGDYFLVLNQDVALDREAVAEMVAAARGRDSCAAVVPKLRFLWAPGFLNGIGNAVADRSWGSDNAIGHLDLGQFDRWQTVPSACFAATLIPRAAWLAAGPADEGFTLYYEDVEWSYRARSLGYTIDVAPRAIVYHALGSRVPSGREEGLAPWKLRHVAYGRLRFAATVVPRPFIGRFLRHYRREDWDNLEHALSERDWPTVRAYARAWTRWLAGLPRLLARRRALRARISGLGHDLFAFEREIPAPRLWRGLPELTWESIESHYRPLLESGRTRSMPEIAPAPRRPNLLIVSHDVVGEKIAGPGLRYLEMARALAPDLDVTLAVPNETTESIAGARVVRYREDRPGSLHVLVENADIALVSGYMADKFPFLRDTRTRLVVDLYDPLILENLHYHADAPAPARDALHRKTIEVTNRLARLGDFFVCGNERQRDFWLGLLAANDRVNPRTAAADSSLRSLIDVVSMGMPSRPPEFRGARLRGVHPGFPADCRIVLWGGGLWDWLDPLTLVRAWPEVVARVPEARLVFLGTRHPNPDVPQHAMAARTLELAREVGEAERSIFFAEWLSRGEHESLLCEADVGAALHPVHLETRYSIRSRVLDYLWASLPVLVTEGDVTSEWVCAHDVGRVVPPADAGAVSAAVLDLLGRPRAARGPAFQPLHQALAWESVVAPLRGYCLDGGFAGDRQRAAATFPQPARAASAGH